MHCNKCKEPITREGYDFRWRTQWTGRQRKHIPYCKTCLKDNFNKGYKTIKRFEKSKGKIFRWKNPIFLFMQMFEWRNGNRVCYPWRAVNRFRLRRGMKPDEERVNQLANYYSRNSRSYQVEGIWRRPMNQFKLITYVTYEGYGRLEIVVPRFALNG